MIALGALVILGVQAVASLAFRRDPYLPSPPPLVNLPLQVGEWTRTQEGEIAAEVIEMLGPDDALAREYRRGATEDFASLFVSYYRTQLRAKNAHDPKVCLPGSGWNPRESKVIDVGLPDGRTFPVNYYRIARGTDEAIVLYWFQTHNGAVAHEQQLRFRRLISAIQYNRTDMALVRIVVPVGMGGLPAANHQAVQLAAQIYPEIIPYFPPTLKAGS